MAPIESQYRVIVQATPGQLEVDEFVAVHGRPHPRKRHLRLGYDWQLHDVVTGQTVESGHTDDEEDADDEAAKALERARDREAGRLARELGQVEEQEQPQP